MKSEFQREPRSASSDLGVLGCFRISNIDLRSPFPLPGILRGRETFRDYRDLRGLRSLRDLRDHS
jgi:hypothetical protein